MKKTNQALMITALVIGALLMTAGAYFKIMHYPLSSFLVISSFAFDILGVMIYFKKIKGKE
jgi:ABC-type Mn2+/Zn2+ transport system permease subunit